MSELPDADKYRQAIENWLAFMAVWCKMLESVAGLSDEKTETERLMHRVTYRTIHVATRRIHLELERLGLPNNWKPAHEFGIKDFKLPEGS